MILRVGITMMFPRFLSSASASVALLLALAACGGGGEDAPPPAPPPPTGLQPTLASIQANVFTPSCAKSGCHADPGAMLGLNLEAAGQSAANLINVPSFYGGMIVRVIPGNPNDSFLIQKLEGPLLGARMPADGLYLQQVTVDVIRQWILDGALP